MRPLFLLSILSRLSALTRIAAQDVLYRINCGGLDFTDSSGREWQQDTFFDGGKTYSKNVDIDTITSAPDATDQQLYQAERYNDDMTYSFPVAEGAYEVRLHFAEIYLSQAEARVFDVFLEGGLALNAFDIYAEAGGNAAIVKALVVDITDGFLNIEFGGITQKPKCNGIEVIGPVSTPPPEAFVPIYVNAGGGAAVVDNSGIEWNDGGFGPGTKTYSVSSTIGGVDDPSRVGLFQTERYVSGGSDMTYAFKVPPGNYFVTLYFCELYFGAVGARVFSVEIQGNTVLTDFDIVAEAGGKAIAVDRMFETTMASGGDLIVKFISTTNNAKLSALEVTDIPPAPSPSPAFIPIYVNAGGGAAAVVDNSGIEWNDVGFGPGTGKYSVSSTIGGVDDPSRVGLFQTERFDLSGGSDMTYTFKVPPGYYYVTLYFCELYFGAVGARVFSVEIQGNTVLTDFDIVAEAGGKAIAVDRTFETSMASGGDLIIKFISTTNNAKLSALEVTDIPPAPSPEVTPAPPTSFEEIHINVGSLGDSFIDGDGNEWIPDTFFTGGNTYSTTRTINGATDPSLTPMYQTERYAQQIKGESSISYEIPVPDGFFTVTVHFAEIFAEISKRVFDVFFEEVLLIDDLDIVEETGGIDTALSFQKTVEVRDGFLSVLLTSVVENCKLSGIQVVADGSVSPHYAHAVPGGPYFAVAEEEGQAMVPVQVDGSFSHTHQAEASVISWNWTIDGELVGEGESPTIMLSPTDSDLRLVLEVEDSFGDISSDFTFVTVRGYGYPTVSTIDPDVGDVVGGDTLSIFGTFFTSEQVQAVKFGSTVLTGAAINILSDTEIIVTSPSAAQPETVQVSVTTSDGETNSVPFTYLNSDLPLVEWESVDIALLDGPTSLAFGPDGKLYIGTQFGEVFKWTLDDDFNLIEAVKSDTIQTENTGNRAILGIALDPNDNGEYPSVYCAHSLLFHKQDVSYNGKVTRLSGPELDQWKDIVTGIPISDRDHGVNGLEFGDNDELYIQNGGNTNAGVPGRLSSREQLDENWFSAATLVARGVHSQDFDGDLTYDSDGLQTGGWSVSIFAHGMRNPFDIVLHSNGKLYGTDNGPNNNFGKESVTCTVDAVDPAFPDKLNLIVEGNYYGHPNRLRGSNGDERQCTFREPTEVNEGYTPPIAKFPSSTNGMCEFQTEHFGGQLRGQLIVGRYLGELRNVKLAVDGKTTVSGANKFPPLLVNKGGLDVTQGPDGSLFVADNRPEEGKIHYHRPVDVPSTSLKVKSVFPRRGPKAGGSTLTIFGENFIQLGTPPSVTVGGNPCTVLVSTSSKITCTIPSGAGKADVAVVSGALADVFIGGHRYTNVEPGSTAVQRALKPESTTSNSLSSLSTAANAPFGISGFVFVDATSNNDIAPVPCNNCFGSETIVNIRANLFGDHDKISSVLFAVSKPPGASSTIPTESVALSSPFMVWSASSKSAASNSNSNSTIKFGKATAAATMSSGYKLTSGEWQVNATAYSLAGVPSARTVTQRFTISPLRNKGAADAPKDM